MIAASAGVKILVRRGPSTSDYAGRYQLPVLPRAGASCPGLTAQPTGGLRGEGVNDLKV